MWGSWVTGCIEAKTRALIRQYYARFDRGEIAKTVRIRELASMMIATHDGMMLEWHRRGTKIDGGQLARTVMSTFMRGVIPQP